jgi:hypothetical protein
MDIVVWLRSLSLGKYEAAFRENDIDETVLPSLTHENLKDLGAVACWRKQIRVWGKPTLPPRWTGRGWSGVKR